MNIIYQVRERGIISLTLTLVLWFIIPQFLLSLFSTLNFLSKSSLKILYRHPSLIILPTVTFFTFSRHNICYCCSENSRVSFSKKFTWLNIAFSIIAYVAYGVRIFISLDPSSEDFLYSFIYFAFFLGLVLYLILPLHVLTVLLTVLFLHTDKLCCCYCNPRDQLSVYDPKLNKRLIMVDGELVEDPDNVENLEVTLPAVDVSTPRSLTLNGVRVK